MRGNRQKTMVKCSRCGHEFEQMLYGSSDISSMVFPVYKIQRYKDYDSKPADVNLCTKCCDDMDRFLFIQENGKDYYRDDFSTTE